MANHIKILDVVLTALYTTMLLISRVREQQCENNRVVAGTIFNYARLESRFQFSEAAMSTKD